MDKEYIIELSKKRAQAAATVRALGMQNAYGLTPEQSIAASAKHQLARDAFLKAESDYQNAIKNLTTDELIELAG